MYTLCIKTEISHKIPPKRSNVKELTAYEISTRNGSFLLVHRNRNMCILYYSGSDISAKYILIQYNLFQQVLDTKWKPSRSATTTSGMRCQARLNWDEVCSFGTITDLVYVICTLSWNYDIASILIYHSHEFCNAFNNSQYDKMSTGYFTILQFIHDDVI